MLRSRLRTMVLAVAMMVPVAGVRAQDADKLFPRDSEIVAQFNVRQLLDSPLIMKYLGEKIQDGLKEEETAKMLKAFNLDPMKHISQITFATTGIDPNEARYVVVIDGKFDTNAMEESIATYARTNPKELSPEKLGEKTVYKVTNDQFPIPVYLGIISDKRLVVSTKKDTVKTAFAGTGKNELSEEMGKLVSSMSKTATISIVADVRGKLGKESIPDLELRKLLEFAETMSMQLNVDDGLGLKVGLVMDKEANATAMSVKLNGLLSLANAFLPSLTKEKPEMKPLIGVMKGIKESAKGKVAQLELKLSKEELYTLIPKE